MNNTIKKAGNATPQKTKVKPEKEKRYAKIVFWIVFLSFAISVVYLIFRFFTLEPGINTAEDGRMRSDYMLMVLQCLVGMSIINLPGFLNRRFKLDIPTALQVFFMIFLFCAIYLGEVRSFYYHVPHWDDILHGSSAVMTGLLGFMLIVLLNKSHKAKLHLSPLFMALFAFCFAVTVGAMWEIYEFTLDVTLGMNMQKVMLKNGELLSGHRAVADTMKDIIVDTCGALVTSVVGYFSVKHRKGWVHRYIRGKNKNT